MAQVVVIIQVLMAEGKSKDLLSKQILYWMLNPLLLTVVDEAFCKSIDDLELLIQSQGGRGQLDRTSSATYRI